MDETTKISLRNHAVSDQGKQDNTVSVVDDDEFELWWKGTNLEEIEECVRNKAMAEAAWKAALSSACHVQFDCPECRAVKEGNETVGVVGTRYGQNYAQFCQFRNQVQKGMNPLMCGDGYIVMSRKYFDEMYNSYLKKGEDKS